MMTRMLAVSLSLVAISPQPGTILDFEDFASGTRITTQYGDRGVLLPFGGLVSADSAASSGTRVLRAGDPADEFHQGPFVLTFSSGQRRVQLNAGLTVSDEPLTGTLRAFDASNTLIIQDGPRSVPPKSFSTSFSVFSPQARIRRIELQMGTTEFEAIDDLRLEGDVPPPPPVDAPVVTISAPADNAEFDAASVNVEGTVTGEGLFPRVRLRLETGRPPDSTAPPIETSIFLSGAGSEQSFVLDLGLDLGPHVMTVEAENTAALKGSDVAHVINLPEAIRQRFAEEGGAATFGALRYGAIEGDCKIAVYEQGAVALRGSTTHVSTGPIFEKWFGLRDPGAPVSRVGCATGDQRESLGGAIAQDFSRGRIYANLPTGAHYVPSVFVVAIDTLGGEEGTGVPIMDPTDSSGVMQTWLFQRFSRPDHPQLLPSTLEIRGNPPVLFVARHGGDLSELFLGDSGVPLPDVPTLWLRFECAAFLGPCAVSVPTSGERIEDADTRFCDAALFPDRYPLGPPEWSPVLGDHSITSMVGIVRSSHFASQDNPFTHEHHGFNPPWPSDWNVGVRPSHPFRNLVAENTYVEVEFEAYFANAFFTGFGRPRKNDLFFTAGRLVIDCGHGIKRSEIHPPFVTAQMRTEQFQGQTATQANIWVNGFYTGRPVSLDIFPPPRPSPNALLNIAKPIDAQASLGVTVALSTPDFTQARVRFSAPLRLVEVTSAGEMKWQAGRAYYGRWHVWWSEK